MRHRIGGRQFGLPSDQRQALLKGLLRSLIIYKQIETTEARGKEIRPLIEKLITRAKNDESVNSRRIVRAQIGGHSADDESIVKELFDVIAPTFKERSGGYTRMARVGARRGDAAMIVMIQFVANE